MGDYNLLLEMTKQTTKIGLGTAAIGRPQYINLRQEVIKDISLDGFIKKAKLILDKAYLNGIRYFDTAPGYGMAEKLLIDWVKEKKYKDVEIATKWGYTYIANFNAKANIHEVKEHSIEKLKEQWEESKDLLPYLSSYQIHSATLESGVFDNKEVLDLLGNLKSEYGLLIGLTATGANQNEIIEKSLEIKRNGETLFDVFQVTYNLLDQSLEQLSKLLTTERRRIIVKEALANGRIFPNQQYPHFAQLYTELEKLAAKYEVGIDAIALRFCIDSIDPFMVLSGASEESHISSNLEATKFELNEDELIKLKQFAISPEKYWRERSQLAWN